VVDQVRNERVVESLSSFFSAEEFGHYYCDQKAHLDALSLDPELENGKLFWIFKNIDYTDWKNVKEGASVLILRGSRNLEDAASQIIRKMTGNKVADLVLHFFYSSLKRLHTFNNLECNWQHVSCVWTLLIQTIEGFPLSQKQCLLTVFFSQALDTIVDEELAKMLPDKPMETIQCLLLHSDLRNLWVALAQTLGKSEQLRLRGTEPKRQTSCQTKRNLAMVFDLNDFSIETYKLLIGIIRGTLRYLRQYYSSVKILLVNPPPTGDLELRESEVLVEYDRERQG